MRFIAKFLLIAALIGAGAYLFPVLALLALPAIFLARFKPPHDTRTILYWPPPGGSQ
jgi:hypothetical protein